MNINLVKIFFQLEIFFCLSMDINANHQTSLLDSLNPPRWATYKMMKQIYTVPPGIKVRLKCRTTIPMKTEWFKNDIPLEYISRPNLKYKIKDDKQELIIPEMTYFDEANFTCIVSNDHGILNFTFRVEYTGDYIGKPILISQSNNQTVMEGMSVEMMCKFQSNLAHNIFWFKLNETIDEKFNRSNPNSYKLLKNPKDKPVEGNVIHIRDTKPQDTGTYVCIARVNSHESAASQLLKVLSINEVFIEYPHNQTVALGETATFTCRTHLTLLKHITWVKIEDNIMIKISKGNEVLKINNVTEEDSGFYSCVVGDDKVSLKETSYLNVVDSLNSHTNFWDLDIKYDLIVGIIIMISIFLLMIIFFVCRKLKQVQLEKKQAISNAHSAALWTKKVIIEQTSQYDSDSILSPKVRIEKQNCVRKSLNRPRLGSENTTLTAFSEYEMPLDSQWEVLRSSLTLGPIIGQGAFGKVVRAEAKGTSEEKGTKIVAIKMLKDGHSDQDMIDLVSEMSTLQCIGRHKNIINILGVCTQEGPLLVVMEYAEHGNLKDFLIKFGKSFDEDGYETPNEKRIIISTKQLILFAQQVSNGMEFISSKKCIHRDLAARNVLVAEDYIIKIADFGLARDIHANDYYRKTGDGRLPVKWMAPEALFQRKYTTESDVWSFGILLWEIMSMGGTPYPFIDHLDKLFDLIKAGYRMASPDKCSEDVYKVMLACWNSKPFERPTFTQLVKYFDEILTKNLYVSS